MKPRERCKVCGHSAGPDVDGMCLMCGANYEPLMRGAGYDMLDQPEPGDGKLSAIAVVVSITVALCTFIATILI